MHSAKPRVARDGREFLAALRSLVHTSLQPIWPSGKASTGSRRVMGQKRHARLEQFLRPASELFEVREQAAGLIARGLPGAVLHLVLETQDASVAALLSIG